MGKIGRKAKELIVTAADRAQLESIARSQSLPAGLARRAQMILRMADGETNSAVARHYRVSRPTVSMWRTRYRERGIAGLHNELKPGRPRSTSEEQIAATGQHGVEIQARGQDALVAARSGERDGPVDDHRAPLSDSLWVAAAPLEELQALDRPVLHREGARHRRFVP